MFLSETTEQLEATELVNVRKRLQANWSIKLSTNLGFAK